MKLSVSGSWNNSPIYKIGLDCFTVVAAAACEANLALLWSELELTVGIIAILSRSRHKNLTMDFYILTVETGVGDSVREQELWD